jgi:hypothetical protein
MDMLGPGFGASGISVPNNSHWIGARSASKDADNSVACAAGSDSHNRGRITDIGSRCSARIESQRVRVGAFVARGAALHLSWAAGYAEFMPQTTFNPLPNCHNLGVILVDHGSLRDESNAMLLDVVDNFEAATGFAIVEPAHMELAEPSIDTAFSRCVARGATTIVVFPYFLLPGRHWNEDIPRLAAAAASKHAGIRFLVTAPFGLHPLMANVMRQRIDHCLAHVHGATDACELCAGTDRCQLRGGG